MPKVEGINRPGPKRLLSVDCGGIRGVLSLGILQRIEALLKPQSERNDYRSPTTSTTLQGRAPSASSQSAWPSA
jgi:hypothetical protein